jgi:hypothetical protein
VILITLINSLDINSNYLYVFMLWAWPILLIFRYYDYENGYFYRVQIWLRDGNSYFYLSTFLWSTSNGILNSIRKCLQSNGTAPMCEKMSTSLMWEPYNWIMMSLQSVRFNMFFVMIFYPTKCTRIGHLVTIASNYIVSKAFVSLKWLLLKF